MSLQKDMMASPQPYFGSSMWQMPASYVIYKDGLNIRAKNAQTGAVDFTGTDASTVIQNVINALTSGGTIFIRTGIYTLLSVLTLLSKIELVGEGRSTILKLGADLTHLFTCTTKTDIKISDMEIDGDKANRGGTTAAFELYDSLGGVFVNLCIHDFTGHGIYLRTNTVGGAEGRNLIVNNEFYNNNYPDVELGTGGLVKGVHSNRILCNLSRNNTRSCIRLNNSDRNIIANNRLINCGTEFIDIIKSQYNVVEANLIEGGANATITNSGVNILADSNGAPFSDAFYNVVKGNLIYFTGVYGIILAAGSYCVVEGNIIVNCGQLATATYFGIYVSFAGTHYSIHNIIKGNVIVSTAAPVLSNGVVEADPSCDYNIITENNISGIASPMTIAGANSIEVHNSY